MTADVLAPIEEKPIALGNWIGFFSMAFGVFMAVLDIQIVSSSLQEIQAGLSATQDEIAWVQTSYLIAEVIIIPLSGWLGKVFSTRYLYVLSAAGFTLASLACALAWNLPSMIIFRCIQGFFGGAMIPMTFSIIFIMFPPRLQSSMSIVLGLIVTLAPTIGPILGGYLTDAYNWQLLFLINILPGFLVCFFVFKFLDVDKPDWALLKKIDFVGIALIAICLGSLQYVLEEGARNQWFEDDLILGLMLTTALSGIAMFWWELTHSHPIVDFRAFKNRNFAIGCAFSFVLGIGLYTLIYLIPIYLGSVKGLNSLQIGYYLMVMGIFQLVSAMVAGALEKKMDLRVMLTIGMGLFAFGSWMNSQLTAESGYWEFFIPQAIRGGALMLCFLPINNVTLGLLPPDEVQNGSSLYNLLRNLGGAMGLAVVNTSMLILPKHYYAILRESVSATDVVGQNLTQIQIQMLTNLAVRESAVMSFNYLFQVITFIFIAVLLLAPFLKKVDAANAPAGH
jgi:DHA2 family multidrug resistance protein